MKMRSNCARWVSEGSVRINRQPTEKPHARLRCGDVLTLPLNDGIRIVRVVSLATRRGPPAEARTLYEEVAEPEAAQPLPPDFLRTG